MDPSRCMQQPLQGQPQQQVPPLHLQLPPQQSQQQQPPHIQCLQQMQPPPPHYQTTGPLQSQPQPQQYQQQPSQQQIQPQQQPQHQQQQPQPPQHQLQRQPPNQQQPPPNQLQNEALAPMSLSPQQQQQQQQQSQQSQQSQVFPGQQETYIGFLKSFSQKDGYGFISCNSLCQAFKRDVFVEGAKLPPGAFTGCRLSFSFRLSNRGHPQVHWAQLIDASNLPDPEESLDTSLLRLTDLKQLFTICLEKKNKKSRLGIDVDTTNSYALVVDAVSGGLVEEWNNNNPQQPVQAGDCIVEVNGVVGDAGVMLKECRASQRLDITLKRGPEGELPEGAGTGVLPTVLLVSWNLLSGAHSLPQTFPSIDPALLEYPRRRAQAAAALRHVDPDVICLQGVDCDLEELGLGSESPYDVQEVPSRSPPHDRVLIAWKRAKLGLGPSGVRQVCFDDMPPPPKLAPRYPGEFNTGCVGLVVELCALADPGKRCFTVATTHLSWNPGNSEIYAWQLHTLWNAINASGSSRLVLAGCLNFPPDSPPHRFLAKGCMLHSIYKDLEGQSITSGRGSARSPAMSDYVWYTRGWMCLLQRLALKTFEEHSNNSGCDSKDALPPGPTGTLLSEGWPSDNLMVGGLFELSNPDITHLDEWSL